MHISLGYRLVLTALTAACATVASAATQITLREKVEMTKYVVRLGDVAAIDCDDAKQARELASLPLMPAPVAGVQRFVQKREIEDSLAAHGVEVGSLTIDGASQVAIVGSRAAGVRREVASGSSADSKVDRRTALVTGRVSSSNATVSDSDTHSQLDNDEATILNDGVSSLISSYLKTKSPEAGGGMVACDVPPRYLASLAMATSRPVCQGGVAPWTGRQRFEISFATAAGTTKFPVYADVQPAAIPVAVALRAMARGEVMTAADVELQDVGYVSKPGDRRSVARSVDVLIGMEIKQPIPVGGIVFLESLQPPVLVKRGELVQVSSQSGGIRVRTSARALQDRAKGQLVELESLATKERFDARVVGPGQAVIVAAATPAVSERTGPIETARLR